MKLLSRLLVPALPALLLAGLAAGCARAQAPTTATGQLTVRVDRPGARVSPTFYGLMTEEINHSYEGGLYAELIQNRDFKNDPTRPVHWALVQDGGGVGAMALDTSRPVPGTALTTCLRLDITDAGQAGGRVGVANDGFWGIPVREEPTRASFYAQATPGTGPLTVGIEGADGKALPGLARTVAVGTAWKKYTVTFPATYTAASAANRFVISARGKGSVWLTEVSLMPPTYNNRANGLRPDLMRLMGGMHPAFLRLPGGNYVEGNTIAERFDWKKTIGPVESRPGHPSPWGYHSTDGMGLLEMLEWCEDLHMQPVLAVFAGFALGGEHVPAGPGLTPYVQDALDEIEYVTGGPQTRWGARRVADGHPAPFPLTYVEIGNEDFFDRSGSYDGRYAQFYDAIKASYPRLQLIATMGVRGHTVDVIDDHYYRSAAQMAGDAGHYDSVSRTGPKIFVGEWASTEGSPTPTFQAALGDAAWLTGLERNADLVVLESYAPLLVNVNPGGRQWDTNLIGYDALNSYGSPSYYVQSLFAGSHGDVILPTSVTPAPTAALAALPAPHGRIGVATWATQAEFRRVKVTQGARTLYAKDFATGDADWTPQEGQWVTGDGVLRQTGDGINARITTGDAAWGDYTLSLQARKLGGKEGFLIAFHVLSDTDKVWWNVGGWGNTRTALQRFQGGGGEEIGGSVPVTVETGRWYDVRIEVQGRAIRCFLDGKLITQATDAPPTPAPLYAASSRDTATGDVILKVVNISGAPQPLRVDLQGASGVAHSAILQELTGDPAAVNTVDAPLRVSPRTTRLSGIGRTFLHTFPAHSVSVLRVGARK